MDESWDTTALRCFKKEEDRKLEQKRAKGLARRVLLVVRFLPGRLRIAKRLVSYRTGDAATVLDVHRFAAGEFRRKISMHRERTLGKRSEWVEARRKLVLAEDEADRSVAYWRSRLSQDPHDQVVARQAGKAEKLKVKLRSALQQLDRRAGLLRKFYNECEARVSVMNRRNRDLEEAQRLERLSGTADVLIGDAAEPLAGLGASFVIEARRMGEVLGSFERLQLETIAGEAELDDIETLADRINEVAQSKFGTVEELTHMVEGPSRVMTSVPLADRRVLEILYDALDGEDWIDNANWKTDKPLDEWYGVSADADSRVAGLVLENNRLFGEIPPELGSLSNLEALALDSNRLRGEIPPELGNLSNLEVLCLRNNSLTGEIPPELGCLSSLRALVLSDNQLTGAIPPELGSLILGILILSRNSLTGAIPPELGHLSNLVEWLDLSYNQLTGEIPPGLGRLSNLRMLVLSDNRLAGAIPPELGRLSSLNVLDLSDNRLTGAIPPQLGRLSNLYELNLSGNGLTGGTPAGLGSLSNLERLSASYDALTGTIEVVPVLRTGR